ncbi:hypothetical protein ISN45_At03g011530 [Arabidopsis thaliana x Arabidopsis arenosa]|uniref:Transmembrane protein n=2 Tax=Arabidopsis TaxID=3701 RepID=A0A1I9LPN3_ARATH|nr:uncharacterized protein AT3G11745 [Arabidopsis thaliana]ANM64541.1 transmembrane protein [Arabidopsis thaliana]KAG7624865.1 hypothetical protein ISN45_At03g011530 [Arabidopsis thaliana x Arabidopsis arenosa]|eukprot:NP_001326560.1 transmembrane protein [Arabidopsis thaliana]
MSQPNLLRSVIAQAIHGEKSVVSRRNFSSLRSKYDEREMFAKTNRRRLLAFLVATSLSFHLWGNVEFFCCFVVKSKKKTNSL